MQNGRNDRYDRNDTMTGTDGANTPEKQSPSKVKIVDVEKYCRP